MSCACSRARCSWQRCVVPSPALRLPIFFFFNDTATTEIYTLSLHDALPISEWSGRSSPRRSLGAARISMLGALSSSRARSEEHTSELQSLTNLVCRLLLEKKKKTPTHEHRQSTQQPACARMN